MLLPLCLLVPLLQDTPADPGPEVVFALHSAGPHALFVDPKDQALLRALEMIEDRLTELGPELGQGPLPPGSIELLAELARSPLELTLGIDSEPIAGMPVPLVGELVLPKDSELLALEMVDDVARFFHGLGVRLEDPAPGEPYVLPAPVPLWMGAESDSFVIRLGRRSDLAVPDLDGLLPEGASAALTGRMDYGRFLQLATGMGGNGEAEEVRQLFDRMGITDLTYEWAIGSDEERQYFVVNLPGWGRVARERGLLPSATLTTDFLELIPADATWATAFSFDLRGLFDYYQSIFSALPGGEIDLRAAFAEATGLDLDHALFDPLGARGCFYASDSTGGGGTLSMVLILELADRKAFLDTLERAGETIDTLGAQYAQGYVRLSRFSLESVVDLACATLTFPGLPVPLELSMTSTDRYAIFAMTPQAALAAYSQIVEPKSSLLDNPGFQEQLPLSLEGCTTIQWVDTPRLIRDGYGTVALACSALANAVRSPGDPAREPGMILPSYRDFGHEAKAIVGVVRMVGDDFRSEYRADRSQLVNAAGAIGMLYNGPLLPIVGMGMGASLVVPNVMQSREVANRMKVEADLTMIWNGLDEFAINNSARYPDTLDVLVIPDENGYRYLPCTELPVDPWGEPYCYQPPIAENEEPRVWCRSLEDR